MTNKNALKFGDIVSVKAEVYVAPRCRHFVKIGHGAHTKMFFVEDAHDEYIQGIYIGGTGANITVTFNTTGGCVTTEVSREDLV